VYAFINTVAENGSWRAEEVTEQGGWGEVSRKSSARFPSCLGSAEGRGPFQGVPGSVSAARAPETWEQICQAVRASHASRSC